MHVRPVLAALAVAGTCAVVGVTGRPASAAAGDPCLSIDAQAVKSDTGHPSVPFGLLDMAAAQDVVPKASTPPVRVAVLDSGVAPAADIPVAARRAVVTDPNATGTDYGLPDGSGTEVAGLVAGAAKQVGFAPDAEIVDVRVYLTHDAQSEQGSPNAKALASGLDWVADHAHDLNIKVATVGFVVGRSPALRTAVEKVLGAKVVLVAATGDRPPEGSTFGHQFEGTATKDEDAATTFYPAGYPGVVAVNSTSGGAPGTIASQYVVKNSRTTVAAPTYDAVSYARNGATCLVDPLSTAAAAGEVSGVVALLWQMFPDDKPAQIVARLVDTANGTTDDPTPLTGAGVVQPYEALTRPLDPSSSGAVEHTVTQAARDTKASAPRPDADPMARTRDDVVWWGLIGGGVLVVALLLRPVLARRR